MLRAGITLPALSTLSMFAQDNDAPAGERYRPRLSPLPPMSSVQASLEVSSAAPVTMFRLVERFKRPSVPLIPRCALTVLDGPPALTISFAPAAAAAEVSRPVLSTERRFDCAVEPAGARWR